VILLSRPIPLFDRRLSLRPDLPLPVAVVSSGGQGWPSR
jgi:hypothetical protein